jgi:hypothetical protein
MTYRALPKPDHYFTAPPGTCRWCNKSTGLTPKGKPKTSRWHKECVDEYLFLYWPSEARKKVWARDKGKCACCGIVCQRHGNNWDLDHIKPLVEANHDKSYWQLDNMQTLCKQCHKEKTSREATARAAKRKLEKAKNVN